MGRTSTFVTLAAVLAAVPPVFDGIVAPAVESTGDLSPTLAEQLHETLDLEALGRSDGLMVESRLEVLVEALATLLGSAGGEALSDANPVESADCGDEVHQAGVLGIGPRASFRPDEVGMTCREGMAVMGLVAVHGAGVIPENLCGFRWRERSRAMPNPASNRGEDEHLQSRDVKTL